MDMPAAFAQIAEKVSLAVGAPFWDGAARWSGDAVFDDGGSILTPGQPYSLGCKVQVDSVTESMRREADYTARDMRLLVLASTLDGEIDTDAEIEVMAGPHFGVWSIASVDRDPVGIYWDCRGRQVSVTIERYAEGAVVAVSSVTGDITAE